MTPTEPDQQPAPPSTSEPTAVVPDHASAAAAAHQEHPHPVRWSRYVAVGDSFSEGLWDPYPSPDGTPAPEGVESDAVQRGWTDRLAETLSARRVAAGQTPLEYANLAIRGRQLRPIIAEQLPVALAAQPDLVSLVGGGNDILRPNADVDLISEALEDAVVRVRATGADVLLAAGFKAGGALSFTRGRVGVFNTNIWSIARRHGAYVLDLWGMRCLGDLRLWADDRLHLTPEGHRRVMNGALVGLGLEPDDADFDVPLDPAPPLPFVDKAKADAEWAKVHVVPWVQRRIRGTSSGDGRAPKWPEPTSWPHA
ncbi:SGNH/GDSL hydrolase family protein [Xylanimonas oleitrophica]|uniref:SGNH/GDSL hydrolase family protein n=1 Tax=Xylanimonas oleitrophica TaxID=2607479 RepID=A0A2W5WRE9_9MICO|nr:SGNH/GDSL hydrolase family protein [Xylanimonas oleitrophica]PZR54089.1 SGNH/GDSL hydrolase family protein [Xylanimonas oleitrophica]